ncbi:MAG: transcriptional activator RfaH [Alphaproteobacteria bacterium]|nr:transcriptional activator RfaH [Alphaproteobacteria bacterium]
MKRWYVVHTRTGMERLAEGNLAAQGFNAYLPVREKKRRHARRIDIIKTALFPRYLFVELDLSADAWRSVNGTYGVSYMVGGGERPSAAPIGVVEEIRDREDENGVVPVQEAAPYTPGQVIEITQGPLATRTGIFTGANDNDRVTILLDMLGRGVSLTLPGDAVTAYG